MKIFMFLLIIISYTAAYCQTFVNGHIGMDVVTYKLDHVSDPYIVAGINMMDISNVMIKEATLAYSRMGGTDNLYMGIYIGKKYNKWLIRTGARMTGIIDIGNSTDVALCGLAGYHVSKSIILNIDYSWMATSVSNHTFGINAHVRLYSEEN